MLDEVRALGASVTLRQLRRARELALVPHRRPGRGTGKGWGSQYGTGTAEVLAAWSRLARNRRGLPWAPLILFGRGLMVPVPTYRAAWVDGWVKAASWAAAGGEADGLAPLLPMLRRNLRAWAPTHPDLATGNPPDAEELLDSVREDLGELRRAAFGAAGPPIELGDAMELEGAFGLAEWTVHGRPAEAWLAIEAFAELLGQLAALVAGATDAELRDAAQVVALGPRSPDWPRGFPWFAAGAPDEFLIGLQTVPLLTPLVRARPEQLAALRADVAPQP